MVEPIAVRHKGGDRFRIVVNLPGRRSNRGTMDRRNVTGKSGIDGEPFRMAVDSGVEVAV